MYIPLQCVLTRAEAMCSNGFSKEQVCNGLVLITPVMLVGWFVNGRDLINITSAAQCYGASVSPVYLHVGYRVI